MNLLIGPFCSDSAGAYHVTLIVDGLITSTDVRFGAPGASTTCHSLSNTLH